MKLSLLTRQLIVITILLIFFVTGVVLILAEQRDTFDAILFIVLKSIGLLVVFAVVYISRRVFNIKKLKDL